MAPEQKSSKYDVAAFVWPSYHPDDRAKVFWPMGIGEWETVMKNKANFEGHEQPRFPVWGYVNEADRYVMEMQINAAADHGVNVFIYDWYWYDGMPFLEDCLNEGYLKARNNDRVKFYIMWANHNVGLGWDKRNADDAMAQRNTARIWKGGINRDEFDTICDRWIDRYFPHPSYYKIDGKPVFMLYEMNTFVQGIGGLDAARAALDSFRNKAVKAGFPGIEIQATMIGNPGKIKSAVPGDDNLMVRKDLIDNLGFDSLMHYQYCHFLNVNQEYSVLTKEAVEQWNYIANEFEQPYYPHVSVGWDSSPRTHGLQPHIVKNNPPAEFEKALLEARKFVDEHPGQAPLISINSWNEWTETSYLQPCSMHGYGYLEAVRNVFVEG